MKVLALLLMLLSTVLALTGWTANCVKQYVRALCAGAPVVNGRPAQKS